MGAYTAIADAGATIIEILRDSLCPEPIASPDLIGLCSPAETGDLQLGLYLYSVKQNREYRMDGVVLTLYYLLTAYSSADIQQRAYDEDYILGAAIQALNENGTINSAYLQGSLGSNGEDIRNDLFYISPEDIQKIWIFPNIPYRTSVAIMVYPIIIDNGAFAAGPRVR